MPLSCPFHAPFKRSIRSEAGKSFISTAWACPSMNRKADEGCEHLHFPPILKGPSPSGSWFGSYNRYRGGCQRRPQSRRGTLRVSHTRRRWLRVSGRALRMCTPSPRPWLWGGIALFIRLDFRTSNMACWWSIPFVDFQDDPGTIVLGFSDGSNALLLTPNAIFEGAMRSWMRPSGLCFMGRRLI